VLTLKKSLPSILRFMVCAVILYCGFLMSVDDKEYRYLFYLHFFSAGWVIIGPYSMKVSDFSTTSINKFLSFLSSAHCPNHRRHYFHCSTGMICSLLSTQLATQTKPSKCLAQFIFMRSSRCSFMSSFHCSLPSLWMHMK
jgi:hypothetical protein